MAKEVAGLIKLQIKGGAANPSPPVGPALGSKGINIMEFCKQFNARTQDKAGKILPVIITYYADTETFNGMSRSTVFPYRADFMVCIPDSIFKNVSAILYKKLICVTHMVLFSPFAIVYRLMDTC